MLQFLAGFFVGGIVGFFIFAMCNAASNDRTDTPLDEDLGDIDKDNE